MSKSKKDSLVEKFDINNLKFYYGSPNYHIDLTDNRNRPYDTLELAKRSGLDFIVITDYNSNLDGDIDDKEDIISKWKYLLKSVNRFNKKNENFIAFHGFEVNNSPLGTFNIINPKSYFSGTLTDIKLLILWLLQDNNNIVSIKAPNKLIDSIEYNELINQFIHTIETLGVQQKKYINFEKYYYSLLDKGWRLGVINSQDSSREKQESMDKLTGIICHTLDKNALIESLKNKHTFSTDSKSLRLFFTINSIFMGGEVDSSDSLDFYIFAEDNLRKINKIQIISNTGKVVKEITDINLSRIRYIFKKDFSCEETWYVIKITFYDEKIAISSPIFII